jgi:hypothetical protein
MNKENKKRLVGLKVSEVRRNYPTIPDHALPQPKYSDKTANGLTKCVIDFLKLSGWQAERISNTGRFIVDNQKLIGSQSVYGKTKGTSGKYIKGTGTNGTADISATIKGLSVKIEIKIGADRQSQAQKDYEQAILKAGGIYIIVKTFDEFIQWYDTFIQQR